MAARIESGAATLCHAWLLRRAHGVETGFTDHDRDLTVGGVTCRAASGWTAGAADSAVGLAAGSAAIAGALDDDAITEADVEAGLYDGATVALWRVDRTQPDLRVLLWTATLARIRRDGAGLVAELEGPLARLERVVGRTYGRTCDALLGDGRCRVDPGAFPGAECDKRWDTCVGTFANGINFQGFPDIPGDDFLTAAPVEGGPNDGGSRPVSSRAVAAARTWLGTPYRHQASVRGEGADCLGLVRGVWRELVGGEPEALPAYQADWAEVGGEETLLATARRWLTEKPVAEATVGDVLMFRMAAACPVKHCAILSDTAGTEPRMIHAYWGRAVVESWMGTWWRRRLVAAFSWPACSGGDD